jgi:hypothetical protein
MKRIAILAVAVASLLLVPASARAAIPFIEDDYKTALARASAKNIPIFVEAWAPW